MPVREKISPEKIFKIKLNFTPTIIPNYFCFMLLAGSSNKPRAKINEKANQLKSAENKMAQILKIDDKSTLINPSPVNNEIRGKKCMFNEWFKDHSKVKQKDIEVVNFSKKEGFVRVPKKSLKLKKVSRHPPDSDSYFNSGDLSLVFQPLYSASDGHNLKLICIKNKKDRDFFFEHALSLARPKTVKRWQCGNCSACDCYKAFLSGLSAQCEIETRILEESLYLLTGSNFKPHFGADFSFDTLKLLQLPTNEEQALRQMLSLEIRLKKLDGQYKFHGVLANFNKKMAKLTSSDLCLFGNDPRLNGLQQHFIRFSFIGSKSVSTPLRPVSDLSYIPAPNPEVQVSLSEDTTPSGLDPISENDEVPVQDLAKIDKSLKGAKKPQPAGGVSFNSCLLTQARIYADILRSFRGWQSLKIIMLADIKSFYWCISTSYKVCSLQRFWFRPKGLGSSHENDMIEYASMSALFGASSSPQNAEYCLRGAVANKIKGAKGCQAQISVHLIHQLAYVDNLIFASDSSPLFDEGLSLYQIYKDVSECIALGSLFLQDLTLPYHGILEEEKLSPEYIQKKCDEVEKYFEKLSSNQNSSRLYTGFPEAMIEIAQLECKISVLEFSDTFENAKKYLHDSNKLGHAFSKWESCTYHNVKFSNDHGFPESLTPIRDYARTNTLPVNTIINTVNEVVDQPSTGSNDAPKILYKKKLTKAEKKANPTIVETNPNKGPKAKPSPEALDLELPKRFAKAAPVDFATKHAKRLNDRMRNLERELAKRGKVPQDMLPWEQKFLGKKYNPVSDTYTYKASLSFSSTKRGISEYKLANFEEIKQHLMTKDTTKRQFLSYIAKLSFSNDGMNSGFILQLRQSYRHYLISMGSAKWSDIVPKDPFIYDFLRGVEQIHKLCFFSFPRSFAPLYYQKHQDTCQVVGFSDASELAATFAIFLRHTFYIPGNPEPQTYTYMAKSGAKVIPLQYISVPELETLAFLELCEETQHFINHIRPYYPCLTGPVYATDSLNLCLKLLPTSAIFRVQTASRLQKIKELCASQNIYDSIAWIRGGSQRIFQNNLSDSLGKPFYSIHHLVCYDQLFGSFLNEKPETWPFKYLRSIRPVSCRQFQDILAKYQGIISKIDNVANDQFPTEKRIKSDLINFLGHVQVRPSILKAINKEEEAPLLSDCSKECIMFTHTSEEPDSSECDFQVCSHDLPDTWTLNTHVEEKVDKKYLHVKFLPTASWQKYDQEDPVINIARFLPEEKKIYEIDVSRSKKNAFLNYIYPIVETKQLYWKQMVSNEEHVNEVALNLVKSLNPKVKIEKKLKNKQKFTEIKKSKNLKTNKLKILPDGSVSKYYRGSFSPVPQPFDKLLASRWNIFATFGILAKCLKFRPEYKNMSRLNLNIKVEHKLLQLCAENTRKYLAQSRHSDVDIVFVDGVFLQKLRGFKGNPTSTFRVYLPAVLEFSQAIGRFVHLLSCGFSSTRQVTFIKHLGYFIPNIQNYLEKLTKLHCITCLRRAAQQQQKSLSAIPPVLGQFQTPYQVSSCDVSYGWYYRQGRFRERIFHHHFICIHTRVLFTVCQTRISAENFVKSLLLLASCYGTLPSLLYLDLGSDYISVQKQILDSEEESVGESRSVTKQKGEPTKLRRYIDLLDDAEKEKMVRSCSKFGIMLNFHASQDSHLTFAEPFIHKFKTIRKMAGFDSLKLNFEDYNLSARLSDNVLNNTPLLFMRDREDVLPITPMHLLMGRTNFTHPLLSHVEPFDESSIQELNNMSYLGQQAYFEFYQARLQHILEFYDKKPTYISEVLGRPPSPGDLCLYRSRHNQVLKLCVIVGTRDVGIPGYTQSSKFKIKFCPQNKDKLQSDNVKSLRQVWPTQYKSVGFKSLTPLLSKEKLYLNLEDMISDLGFSQQQLEKINKDIDDYNSNRKGFHTQLLNVHINPAMLSQSLLNEVVPSRSPSDFYRKNRPLKYGLKNATAAKPSKSATDLQVMRNLIIPKLVPTVPESEEPTDPFENHENTDASNSSSDSDDNFQLIPEEVFINDDLSDVPSLSITKKIKEVKVKKLPEEQGEIRNIPNFTKSKKKRAHKRT